MLRYRSVLSFISPDVRPPFHLIPILSVCTFVHPRLVILFSFRPSVCMPLHPLTRSSVHRHGNMPLCPSFVSSIHPFVPIHPFEPEPFLPSPFWAAAPKGSMTYDSTQGNFLRVSESPGLRVSGSPSLRVSGSPSLRVSESPSPPPPRALMKVALCGIIGHRPLRGQ